MSSFTVTAVRKELSTDGAHRHLAGVFTADGAYYLRATVVGSIQRGDTWKTYCDGYTATITTMSYCPKAGCLASPYIKTDPTSTKKDNLENLPEK